MGTTGTREIELPNASHPGGASGSGVMTEVDEDAEAAWATEVSRRVAELDGGAVKTAPGPARPGAPDSFPQSLRAGADGNIYFVERNANKIGRVNLN